MSDFLRLLTRCPFTLLMVALLIATGVYGRTHLGPLDDEIHQQTGHSAHLLWRGEIHRVLTSLLFTAGGVRFYSSLAMLAIAVGWVETKYGTPAAILTFGGVHLATLLLMSIGLAAWLTILDSHRGNLLWMARDVGPSAGYYGCLGLAITSLSPNFRISCLAAILSILVVRLTWSSYHLLEEGRTMSADIAHLIAFPLGILLARYLP